MHLFQSAKLIFLTFRKIIYLWTRRYYAADIDESRQSSLIIISYYIAYIYIYVYTSFFCKICQKHVATCVVDSTFIKLKYKIPLKFRANLIRLSAHLKHIHLKSRIARNFLSIILLKRENFVSSNEIFLLIHRSI